jgi:hypothetical protein
LPRTGRPFDADENYSNIRLDIALRGERLLRRPRITIPCAVLEDAFAGGAVTATTLRARGVVVAALFAA